MTKILDLTVYDDISCAVKNGKWYDIMKFLRHGRKRFNTDSDYVDFVKTRVTASDKLDDAKLLTVLKGQETRPEHFTGATLKPMGGLDGCNLTARCVGTWIRSTKNSLATYVVKGSGWMGDAVNNAMRCTNTNHASCVLYQREIMTLLRHHGNTEILLNWKKSDPGIAGYIDFSTSQQSDLLSNAPRIKVKFFADTYKTNSGTESHHVEILSGILFEAGNIYRGNYGSEADKPDDVSHEKEQEVTLHNVRQVLRIASDGGTITQNDWRNVMCMLFASDVDTTNFTMTTDYRAAYGAFHHNVGNA